MKRKQSVIEVKILLDPVLGWGHEAEDHIKLLEQSLNEAIPHYKPEVRLVKVQEVEEK